MAAIAAHVQGEFWPFHDQLFANYNKLNESKLDEIVEKLVLDKAAFEKERKNPVTLAKMRKDIQDGRQAGVRGTPSVFVNGKLLKNRNINGFKAAVSDALKKLSEKSKTGGT